MMMMVYSDLHVLNMINCIKKVINNNLWSRLRIKVYKLENNIKSIKSALNLNKPKIVQRYSIKHRMMHVQLHLCTAMIMLCSAVTKLFCDVALC